MVAPRTCWLPVVLVVVVLASGQPSHIQGSNRRMRMFIKNAFLQIGPGSSVSGTLEEHSPLTIVQRSSVTVGKVKIQGVHGCLYLCMDTCGIPYASKEFWDECVFNEVLEPNHYNTYSSGKYSNSRRTLYLGMNRAGEPRRVQIRGGSLGKLSAYTRVLTQPVGAAEAGLPRCRSTGPPVPRQTAGCLRRPRRRCPRPPCARRRRPHPRRHRKHRASLDQPEDESAEEDDLADQ